LFSHFSGPQTKKTVTMPITYSLSAVKPQRGYTVNQYKSLYDVLKDKKINFAKSQLGLLPM